MLDGQVEAFAPKLGVARRSRRSRSMPRPTVTAANATTGHARRRRRCPGVARTPPRSPTPRKDLIIETLCSERFCDLAPTQVYSTLLDEGTDLCSERQMYRVLDERHLVRERRRGGNQRAGAFRIRPNFGLPQEP